MSGALALDVSNYTGPLSPDILNRWWDSGVRLVIVQAVQPPAGFPPGVTLQQMDMLIKDGRFSIDAYIYLWLGAVGVTDRNLHLLDGYQPWIGNLWLDCEDTSRNQGVELTRRDINDMMANMSLFLQAHDRLGIYTGSWWWGPYTGSWRSYSDHPLWVAQYDGIPDTSVFDEFGGWERCAIKQYRGSSIFEGVAGVDLNVVA